MRSAALGVVPLVVSILVAVNTWECDAGTPEDTRAADPILLYGSALGGGPKGILSCFADEHNDTVLLEFPCNWARETLGIFGGIAYFITSDRMLEGVELGNAAHFRVGSVQTECFSEDRYLWVLNPRLGYMPHSDFGGCDCDYIDKPTEIRDGEETMLGECRDEECFSDRSVLFRCYDLETRAWKEYCPGFFRGDGRPIVVLSGHAAPLPVFARPASPDLGESCVWRVQVFLPAGDTLVEKEIMCRGTQNWAFQHSVFGGDDAMPTLSAAKPRDDGAPVDSWVLINLNTVPWGENRLALLWSEVELDGHSYSTRDGGERLLVWDFVEDQMTCVSLEGLEAPREADDAPQPQVPEGFEHMLFLGRGAGDFGLTQAKGEYAIKPLGLVERVLPPAEPTPPLGHGYRVGEEDRLYYRHNFLGFLTPLSRRGEPEAVMPLNETWTAIAWRGRVEGYGHENARLITWSLYDVAPKDRQFPGLGGMGVWPRSIFSAAIPPQPPGWTPWEAEPCTTGVVTRDRVSWLDSRRKEREARRRGEGASRGASGSRAFLWVPGQCPFLSDTMQLRSSAYRLEFLPSEDRVEVGETLHCVVRLTNCSERSQWTDAPCFDGGALEGCVIGEASIREGAERFSSDEDVGMPVPLRPGESVERAFSITFDKEDTYEIAIQYVGGDPKALCGVCRAPIARIQVGAAPASQEEQADREIAQLLESYWLLGSDYDEYQKRSEIMATLAKHGERGLSAAVKEIPARQLSRYLYDFRREDVFHFFLGHLDEVSFEALEAYFAVMTRTISGEQPEGDGLDAGAVKNHFREVLRGENVVAKKALIARLRVKHCCPAELVEDLRALIATTDGEVEELARAALLEYLAETETGYSDEAKEHVSVLLESKDWDLRYVCVGNCLAAIYRRSEAAQNDPALFRDMDRVRAQDGPIRGFHEPLHRRLRHAAQEAAEPRFSLTGKVAAGLARRMLMPLPLLPEGSWDAVKQNEAFLEQYQSTLNAWADYIEKKSPNAAVPEAR